MGVFTLTWGPHGHTVLHGLCDAFDKWGNKLRRTDILGNLGAYKYIYPCVYCRKSVTKFLTLPETNPENQCSWLYWSYKIHECVNKKLFWQDVKKNPRKAIQKWLGYQPDFKDIKVISVKDDEWWYSLFFFTYYAYCDFSIDRGEYLRTYLHNLADILAGMELRRGFELRATLKVTPLPEDFNRSMKSRIEWVQQVQRGMGFQAPDVDSLYNVCKTSVVGCDPNDKSKVGC